MSGWILLESDHEREVYGRNRKSVYLRDQFANLRWFREAVVDVRKAMNLPGAQVMAEEIHVYEELRVQRIQRGWRWLVSRLLARPIRPRRGLVKYGRSTRIYLSEEGLSTPRVVFEEVAHSMVRLTQIDPSDASLTKKEREYVRALISSQSESASRWWPIRCHLDIFRGFLNQSEALQRSRPADVRFVRLRESKFATCCRLHNPPVKPSCHC